MTPPADRLDTLTSGHATDRITGVLRAALYGHQRRHDDAYFDGDLVARIATEAMRADPAALLAFAAEVTACLAASDPEYGRELAPATLGQCAWCHRSTLVNALTYQGCPTGYLACGSCHVTNRIYQTPAGHNGPWPPQPV